MKVLKFGGTSVGSADAIRRAITIVADTPGPRCVVVSATSGTTDRLAEAAAAAERGDAATARAHVAEIQVRHARLAQELDVPRVVPELDALGEATATLLDAIALLHECTPRSRDAVWAFGERASSRIVAAALEEAGVRSSAVDATDLLITDDVFGNARDRKSVV